jgi:CBS domain-containing protein
LACDSFLSRGDRARNTRVARSSERAQNASEVEEVTMKVRDLMTTSVASVDSREPLSEAARLMWDCDCGAVPVREDGSERIIGMITDRDICIATWSRDRAPSAIPIAEVMSRELFYCTPEQAISSAESLMRSRKIRRIPVLDGDQRLVGILSLADIVTRSQHTGMRPGASELAAAEIAATLANICQPRAMGSSSLAM